MKRKSGVLMHISSLPGEYSCGSFGKEAKDFVDFLERGGFSYWQTLPFCMTDWVNSPYKSYSSFGGNPYFIDLEELAARLMELLHKFYPQTLKDRYKIEAELGTPGYMLLEEAGRKRGYLLSRGEIHTERMAKVLLDEYRSGKLGHFTLEMPEEMA